MMTTSQNSNSAHSISQYIEGLRLGDELAAQKTWERFIERLIRLADKRLKAIPRKAEDEEDVVQKAFADFFRQVQQGRFSKLHDRHDLWQVLCLLVDRRAIDQIKKGNAQRRGGGAVRGESVFLEKDDSIVSPGLAGIPDMMPTADFEQEMSEALRLRLNSFENDEHRQVALLKLQGFTNLEIANQIGSSHRTVERWLGEMRNAWNPEMDNESNAR